MPTSFAHALRHLCLQSLYYSFSFLLTRSFSLFCYRCNLLESKSMSLAKVFQKAHSSRKKEELTWMLSALCRLCSWIPPLSLNRYHLCIFAEWLIFIHLLFVCGCVCMHVSMCICMGLWKPCGSVELRRTQKSLLHIGMDSDHQVWLQAPLFAEKFHLSLWNFLFFFFSFCVCVYIVMCVHVWVCVCALACEDKKSTSAE